MPYPGTCKLNGVGVATFSASHQQNYRTGAHCTRSYHVVHIPACIIVLQHLFQCNFRPSCPLEIKAPLCGVPRRAMYTIIYLIMPYKYCDLLTTLLL